MGRAILVVLDSVGIGGAPDAGDFDDSGSNTLGNVINACSSGKANYGRSGPLKIPNLESLGIINSLNLAAGKNLVGDIKTRSAGYGAATSQSRGKDTPSGHWELVGAPVDFEWLYFKKLVPAFPSDEINKIIARTKIPGILANCHSSGTEIIDQFGEEHIKTGKPIFYTSSDSVIQIAVHEEVFGLKPLLDLCNETARIFHPLRVCRIIARPFLGEKNGEFYRTKNRKDFSVDPIHETVCDRVVKAGGTCWGIGKIGDIFNHRSVTTFSSGVSDSELFSKLIEVLDVADNRDFIFANFVEFDSLYGHRRDVSGYALALEKFDLKIPELLKKLEEDDLLIITADHGNDPTFYGTDHTRERVPVLIRDPSKKEKNHGLINFSDVGNIIVGHLNLPCS